MNDTKLNTQRRAARNMRFMSILGFFMVVAPWLFDINPMDGGGALIMVGFLLGLTGLITYFTFSRRAKFVDDMFDKKNILANWKVTGLEWSQFAEEDVETTKSNAWAIWGVITFFFVLFTAIFWLFIENTDDANFFVLFMGGLWLFISIFALIATSARKRKRNNEDSGEIIISKHGLWLNGESHIWKGMAHSLDAVRYQADKRLLEFEYSFPARAGRQLVEVRVPVASQAKKELQKIIDYFGLSTQNMAVGPVHDKFSSEEISVQQNINEDLDGFEVKM